MKPCSGLLGDLATQSLSANTASHCQLCHCIGQGTITPPPPPPPCGDLSPRRGRLSDQAKPQIASQLRLQDSAEGHPIHQGCIFVPVTIYRRLRIGRDGHLD